MKTFRFQDIQQQYKESISTNTILNRMYSKFTFFYLSNLFNDNDINDNKVHIISILFDLIKNFNFITYSYSKPKSLYNNDSKSNYCLMQILAVFLKYLII